MSGDFEEWRWSDPNGQQRLVRTDELRAGLSSGMIPPNAPVWRNGWKEWQPAYAVPELTTSALAAANGVLANIPPPPLGVLGAQKEMEREALGPMRAPVGAEPPVPPRYVAAPTKISQPPGSMSSSPPPIAVVPPPAPSQTMIEEPVLARVATAADEANTAVLPVLTDADATAVVARSDAVKTPEESIPTAVGVPALPLIPMTQPPPPLRADGPPSVAPLPPPVITSRPPPLPASKGPGRPPPPPSAKNKTMVLFGGAPAGAPPSKAGPAMSSGTLRMQVGTSPRVPGGGAEGIEEISGSLLLDAPVSRPKLPAIEELSGSVLLDAPEGPTPAPIQGPAAIARSVAPALEPSDSVMLSESVRKVATVIPAVVVPPAAPGGTLFGFPAAPLPAQTAPYAPVTEPSLTRREDAPDSGPPSNRRLHDLGAILKTRSKPVYAAIAVIGALVGLGVMGLIIKLVRSAPSGSAESAASASGAAEPGTKTSVTAGGATAAAPPPATVAATGNRCALAGASHTIAPRAVVPSGIEALPLSHGIGLGFATSPKEGMAVELDPTSLNATASIRMRASDPIRRLVPDEGDGRLAAIAETDTKVDPLQGRHRVPDSSVDFGVADGSIAWAPHAKPGATKLWALDGEGAVEALRGVPITFKGEKGIAVTYRRAGAVFIGAAFGDALTPKGPIFRIPGLGPQIGSPTLASVGEAVLLAWADRAAPSDPWIVRWVEWSPGETPHGASAFVPPAGGLGEQTMSPSLAAIGGGRVLLVWTEGAVAAHAVRAQTVGLDGAKIGDPLTISAEGINAGQAQAAVLPDGRGVVAFLAAKGASYEVVATPIACPSAK